MKTYFINNPPYRVGITIISYNLFPGELEMCVKNFYRAETFEGFILQIVETGDVDMFSKAPNGKVFFNRNKGHNFGIKALKGKVRFIICSDADLLIPPFKIDQTIEAAKNSKRCVWSVAVKSLPPSEIHKFEWRRWQREIPQRPAGKGGWNCATFSQWEKVGGWNERMFGRWMDRDLHYRFKVGGVGIFELWDNPLIHIEHPPRFTDEDSAYLKEMVKKTNSWVKFERFL